MNNKRNTLFRLLSPVTSVFPVGFYTGLTKQRTLLPLYHIVSDEDVKHIKHLYPVRNTKKFVRDLDFFLKHYSPVSYSELISGNIKKNSFHLTFDDGLRECHDIVAPILIEKGIPATFFINSGFLDNKNLMYRYKISLIMDKMKESDTRQIQKIFIRLIQNGGESSKTVLFKLKYNDEILIDEIAECLKLNFSEFLKEQQPYLTTLQTENLIKQGFTIGAHSIDHPDYRLLSLEEQLRQTKESIDFISSKFNLNYKTFAFPFTDDEVSNKFFETVFNSSNRIADSTFGCAGIKKALHKNHFQRLPIETNDAEAERIVKFEYLYYMLKAPFGKNKTKR